MKGTTMDNPVVIITGASSGIGLETALAFAERKATLVLAARRQDKLESLAELCRQKGAQALVVPTDVAVREQVDCLVKRTMDAFGRIDVMINNAGFGMNARVHEIDEQALREIFQVNLYGVWYGCRAVAPIMMAQRSGHIFNVSSVIGKRATPFNGGYCATKFAVSALTESMRVEMMDYNVRVTLVCPGLTATEFFDHVRGGSARAKSSFVNIRTMMTAAGVARRIIRTVGRRKPQLVFTPGGKFLVLVAALWPSLADRMLKLYHDDLIKGQH
jgi:short-subunit dehydrogenase